MRRLECGVCGFVYDEEAEGVLWEDLPDDWVCPVCGASKGEFAELAAAAEPAPVALGDYLGAWQRSADDVERHMADIHRMAVSGESIVEPMRTRDAAIVWDDILIVGAQLARMPLNRDEAVNTRTTIGPRAKRPLLIETPIYVTHMSFGALSKEAQTALAMGAAAVGTAIGSGEGGVLPDTQRLAHRFIFEYVPNRYSVTDEMLRRADAIEIKIGQSAKPGMGGLLPGSKVTADIAAVRGFPMGRDIHSPARFTDITTRKELRDEVSMLRERSGGCPIGIKLAAGHIEEDLEFALYARPDFVTLDGRPGGTGAAPKYIKMATSIPTPYALYRARTYLDKAGAKEVSLVITGGFRVSPDMAKALALGADAIAVGTAAMMACGCQQYRVCNTGKCPVGIATQDPELRARLDVDASAKRVANYLRVCTAELRDFARLTGHADVHDLGIGDLCSYKGEVAEYMGI